MALYSDYVKRWTIGWSGFDSRRSWEFF